MITLSTPRLFLRSPKASDVKKMMHFEAKNQTYWAPYISVLQQETHLEEHWKKELKKFLHEFSQCRSVRFFLFENTYNEGPIIGVCHFTQIFRDPFQACYLGYRIDQEYEGKGLMHEALEHAISYMFTIQNLHRIMANYMPSNVRSERLLNRLGFQQKGYAKEYLLINEKWEDHILTALTNPQWKKAAPLKG